MTIDLVLVERKCEYSKIFWSARTHRRIKVGRENFLGAKKGSTRNKGRTRREESLCRRRAFRSAGGKRIRKETIKTHVEGRG
jgi:hypothetical protein